MRKFTVTVPYRDYTGKKMTREETRESWEETGRHKPNPDYNKWKPPPKVDLGLTVVLTSNTLLGQWQERRRRRCCLLSCC